MGTSFGCLSFLCFFFGLDGSGSGMVGSGSMSCSGMSSLDCDG